MSTGIAWADETFNPWWGCSKVSPGCDHCYAETWATEKHGTGIWGRTADRRLFGDTHWNQPLAWNRRKHPQSKSGGRLKVFTMSMGDVFDSHPSLPAARERLWDTIRQTPNLDWLILPLGQVMARRVDRSGHSRSGATRAQPRA